MAKVQCVTSHKNQQHLYTQPMNRMCDIVQLAIPTKTHILWDKFNQGCEIPL